MRFLLTALMILTVLLGFTACDLLGGGGDPESYTVKIMDGDTLVKELTFTAGAEFTFNKADLAKPGYDMVGLYTDANLSAEYKAADGAKLTVSGDLTVYAKYAPKDFYIFIDYNADGDTEDLEVEATYGETYTIADPAERIGYRFAGYERKVNKVWQAFPATGTFNFTEDIEIRVVWDKINYVTVLGRDGTQVGKYEIAIDGTVTLPAVADTATHAFGGYIVDGAAYGEKQADGSYKVTGATASVTAIEKWTAIDPDIADTFDVYFNVNDGAFANGEGGKLTVAEGESINLWIPTREGYVFGGWYAGGVQYGEFNGENYVLSYADWNTTDLLLLTAKWTAVRTEGEQFNGQTSLNYFLLLNGNDYTYVLLTGHSYSFGANATITLGEGADAYVTLNGTNGLKVGNVKGAFSMTISTPATETTAAQSITVDVLVKHYVNAIGATGDLAATTGNAYLNNFYGHATGAITAKKPLAVGLNGFKPEIAITSIGGSKLSLADLKNDYTLTATLNGEDVTALITLNDAGDALTFDPTLIGGSNAGSEVLVTLTFAPKYALKADGIKAFSMTVSINNGVNVYTNKELFDAFEDLNVKTINILRNIKAAIDPKHAYNGNVNDPHNGYEHGVYYRVATVAEHLTVNGNYFKIDGTDLPLIAPYDSAKPGSAAFGAGGYCNTIPYYIVDVQFGIFSYYNNSTENLGQQKLTMNDLYVVGNCQWSDLNNDVLSVGDAKILKYSGSYPGMIFRRTQGEINNCVVTNTNIAYYTNGYTETDGYTPTALISAITLNNSKGEKNWGNGIYAYGQSHVTLNNSFFGASGGPSIHFDDHATTTDDVSLTSKLAVSTDTVFDNYRSGSEGWFVGWNLAGSATLVKGMFNPLNTDPNTNAFLKLKYGRLQAIQGVFDYAKGMAMQQGAPEDMANAIAQQEADRVAALPFTTIPENAKALRQSAAGEEFNFILIVKACGNGWNTEDAHGKVHINLSRIEDGVETPVAANAMNAATMGQFPNYYACFDSKLYMDYEITGFGTVGFVLGLYE